MDHLALLKAHKPLLRYDSNEGYFADSAAEMTDATGNRLQTAQREVIAAAPELSLDVLRPEGEYPGGGQVAADDELSIAGKDYIVTYREVRARHADYRNVVYGRVVTSPAGATWLQYWMWFFNNDLRALGVGLGLHEGDWEGIQLRLQAGKDAPDIAVYAQHGYAAARRWKKVEKRGGRPVVYVAQGSHASYFDDGMPLTNWHVTEHFIDRADGKVTPKGDVRLVSLDPAPGWAQWPGRWGDTRAEGTGLPKGLAANSPDGPGSKPHWKDPDALLRKAAKVGRAKGIDVPDAPAPAAPPPAPTPPPVPAQPRSLEPRIAGGRLQLDFEASADADAPSPTHLLVTVNSPQDAFPPTTFKLVADSGSVEIPLDADPAHAYDLEVSGLTDDNGALSAPAAVRLSPAQ